MKLQSIVPWSRLYAYVFILSTLIGAIMLSTLSCKKEEVPETPLLPEHPEITVMTPNSFSCEDISITKKKLSWEFNYAAISGFKIDRKVNSGDWKVAYLSTSPDQYTAIDSTVIPDSSLLYQYRVYAWAGSSVSLFANIERKFIIPAPSEFTVQNINEVINYLSWTDNSDGEMGFKVDRQYGTYNWVEGFRTFGPGTENFYDTIAGGDKTQVKYKVYAFWDTLYSNKAYQNSYVVLPPPTNININLLSCSQIKITWEDKSAGEQGYKIDRKIAGGEWEIGYQGLGPNTEIFIDNNFPSNMVISYRVYGYVDSLQSTYLTGLTNSNIPPPTNLDVEQQELDKIILSWDDNSIGENAFRVDRRIGNGAWVENYATPGENAETFTDEEFPFNTYIYYRIYAQYNGNLSDEAGANIIASVSAPTNLLLNNSNLQEIVLSWNDNTNGEDGFKIDKKVGNNSWVSEYAQVGANVTTYTDNEVSYNQTVYYKVYAYYGSVNSNASSSSITSTIPAPDDVSGTFPSLDKVVLTWTDNSNGEQGFVIGRKIGAGSWNYSYDQVNENVTLYTDLDFPHNENVIYKVSAFIGNVRSDSSISVVNTDIPKPSDFSAVMTSPTVIVLNWTDNSVGETGFRVDKKINNGSWIENYALLGENVSTYSESGSFTSGETYQYRIYAVYNDNYSSFSETSVIVHLCGNPFDDPRDDNIYETVMIEEQCWMTKNLNYEVSDSWCYDDNPNWCDYGYGRIYRWETIMNGSSSSNTVPGGVQGLCPSGFHIPSDEEWKILEGTVDSQYGVGHPEWNDYDFRGFDAGKKLKSSLGWDNGGNGTDDYGFNALPGGYGWNYWTYNGGGYQYKREGSYFWTSTTSAWGDFLIRQMHYSTDEIARNAKSESFGLYVRCLKDF